MQTALRTLLTTIALAAVLFHHGCAAADPPPVAGEKQTEVTPPAKAPEVKPPDAKPPNSTNPATKPATKETNPGKTPAAKPKPTGIPEKVLKVLEFVDKNGKAMDGYEGGRNFGNFERRLPQTDGRGQRIKYREWDVNPRRQGVNRGAERMVTGSDGKAYYTSDHYNTFKKIR